MRLNRFIGALAASALFSTVALAGGGDCAKQCEGKDKASCAGMSSCEAKLSACMPQMTMMVGDKTFECPMAAAEAAKKAGKSVNYRVAGKDYSDQQKAMAAYADVMEDFAAKFATVRTAEECKASCGSCSAHATAAKAGCCSGENHAAKVADKSGKTCDKSAKMTGATYCVAGQTFDCPIKAAAASKIAMAAMKDIKTGYRVGSKDFCCDKMAGEAAKKDNAKVVYVVGKDTMDCPIQARIMTAKAKIMAAAHAVAEKSTKETVQQKA